MTAQIGANHERLALLCSSDSTACARLAAAHRRSEACQLSVARLHDNYILPLERWLIGHHAGRDVRPVFMSTAAVVAGWQGAVLTLMTDRGEKGLVAASDPAVRAAHELETSLAEGPSREAMHDQSVSVASGPQMERRWPSYGRAARELGVGSVASAPIRLGDGCGVGSVTLMDLGSSTTDGEVHRMADGAAALVAVLQTRDPSRVDGGEPLGLSMFEEADFQPALLAVAGVLHQRHGCDLADGVALIRAPGFAESRSVAEVAEAVIREGGLP